MADQLEKPYATAWRRCCNGQWTVTNDLPCLFIYGANSHYVLQPGREAALRRFPNAEFLEIPNAGHWLHAEQPAAFLSGVTDFLTRQPSH